MSKLRIAGFVRDIGAGDAVSPILLELRRRGHETILFVEKGGKAEGRVAHPAVIIQTIEEIDSVLSSIRPSIVVIGLSSPRYLEAVFEENARSLGIPVVHAEDYLKAFDRSALQADLILSIDETAAMLARQSCPDSKVVVVGFAGIMPIVPRESMRQEFDRVRRETGAKILFCGDADPADSESTIRLLVESILLTKTRVRLIFSPHPKYAPIVVAPGRTQGDVLQDTITPLREKGLLMQCPQDANGDEVAVLADATCSNYSTLLGRAAAAGKMAITFRTPEATKNFKEVTTGRTPGLDKTWFMMMAKEFPVIEEPTPLDEILSMMTPPFRVKPLNVVVAADAIEDINMNTIT